MTQFVCVWFSPHVVLCIVARWLHFVVVCPKDLIPDVLWFI